jgi:hypothetical protein
MSTQLTLNENLGYDKKDKYWVTKLDQKKDICIGKNYPQSITPMTIIERFSKTREEFGIFNAFKYKKNEDWNSISWDEYYD